MLGYLAIARDFLMCMIWALIALVIGLGSTWIFWTLCQISKENDHTQVDINKRGDIRDASDPS